MGCLCDYAPYTDIQKTPVVGKRVENNSIKLNDYIPWGCFSGEILRHMRLSLGWLLHALLHGARVHGCWWIITTIIIIIIFNIISTTNSPSTSHTSVGAVVWAMSHRRRYGPYMMMMMIIQQRRRVDYESALCFVCVWLILLSLMHSRLLFVQVAAFYWETRSNVQQRANTRVSVLCGANSVIEPMMNATRDKLHEHGCIYYIAWSWRHSASICYYCSIIYTTRRKD